LKRGGINLNNKLEQNCIIIRWLKTLLVLLLPTLLLVLLLFTLNQGSRAKPALQQGLNLVPNPGFEEPTDPQQDPISWDNNGSFWWFWEYFRSSVSHEGDYSAGIVVNLSVGSQQWWCDFFQVDANKLYDFSGWIRADGLSDSASLILAFYSSQSQDDLIAEYHSSDVTGSSDWMTVTGSAVAPEGAQYAQVFCNLDGTGTIWCDDIFAGLANEEVPILEISKSDDPDPVEPGQSLVYMISYTNTGNITATKVVITETYDANVVFNSAAPDPTSGNRVWANIGPLGPQGSGSIVVTVTVNSPLTNGLTLWNTVEIASDETEPVSDTTTTQVASQPDLVISKSDDADPVEPEGTLVYTITYENIGTAVCTGLDITDTLPVSVSFESASQTPTHSDTNILVWENLDALDVGAGGTIILTTTVSSFAPRGSSLHNQVLAGCDEGETAEAEEDTAIFPNLISMAPCGGFHIASPGQEVCYNHTIYLTGTQPHSVSLSAISSQGWTTTVDPPSTHLSPDVSEPITACVIPPAGCATISGTVGTITVTVSIIDGPSETAVCVDTTVIKRVLGEIPVVPLRQSTVHCSGDYLC